MYLHKNTENTVNFVNYPLLSPGLLRQALILLHFSPLLSITQQRTFPPKTGAGKCTSTDRFSDKDGTLFCHLPIACQDLVIKSILRIH